MLRITTHSATLTDLGLPSPSTSDSPFAAVQRKQFSQVVSGRDGRQLFGWPHYYSNFPEEGLLYLYDPAWIDDDGNYVDLGAHGIVLTKKDGIEAIIFTKLEFGQAASRPVKNRTSTGGQSNG